VYPDLCSQPSFPARRSSYLGNEKGKPFEPDARQTEILTEAALVGEAMAKANDFSNPRLEDAHYAEGSHWEFATTGVPDQRREN